MASWTNSHAADKYDALEAINIIKTFDEGISHIKDDSNYVIRNQNQGHDYLSLFYKGFQIHMHSFKKLPLASCQHQL